MENKKAGTVTAASLIIFAVSLAALRGLNIYYVYIYNDITYADGFVHAVNILHDVLLLAAYGYSVGGVIALHRAFGKKSAWISAAVMILVKICDSVFSIVWDVTGGAIGADETEKILTASEFAALDTAIFAFTYIAAIAAVTAYIKKRTKQGETDDKTIGIGTYLIIPVSVMTVLELISPIISCIRFFVEYGAPTSLEASQMAGDVLLIVLKYGIVMYGFVFVTCKVFETVLWRKKKIAGQEKNR